MVHLRIYHRLPFPALAYTSPYMFKNELLVEQELAGLSSWMNFKSRSLVKQMIGPEMAVVLGATADTQL